MAIRRTFGVADYADSPYRAKNGDGQLAGSPVGRCSRSDVASRWSTFPSVS